jgi:hypothetical protein
MRRDEATVTCREAAASTAGWRSVDRAVPRVFEASSSHVSKHRKDVSDGPGFANRRLSS